MSNENKEHQKTDLQSNYMTNLRLNIKAILYHFKYHQKMIPYQTKDVEGDGRQFGEVTRKSMVSSKQGCYADLSHCFQH